MAIIRGEGNPRNISYRNFFKSKPRNQKKLRLNLRSKRALAARLLKVPASRVWFNPEIGIFIKDVDSRDDLRVLIAAGVVRVKR